ncbi:hypothetical protein [Eisenibacter elegans]|jgi:hypothetical protein|uniref:hypothetical protein n=1 Tax=Eisenibacter elegans TaxID=997 RepID=UPI0003F76FFB|nr:hypothetical protein [Eisenibacter elegans]
MYQLSSAKTISITKRLQAGYRMLGCFLICWGAALGLAFAQPDSLRTTRTAVQVGETTVYLCTYERGNAHKMVFFNMHDDENTSVEAAKNVIDRFGGRLVELQHSGERILKFRLKGAVYGLDPNRIFTDQGIRQTLSRYSAAYHPEAHEAVRKFAQEMLSLVGQPELIVAAHNNVNVPSFNVRSYAPNGNLAQEAEEAYINPLMGTGEFYYVIERAFFDFFKQVKVSVVLQDNSRVTDDGSLSVYCAAKGIRYINTEAQRGKLQEQIKMLEHLFTPAFLSLLQP